MGSARPRCLVVRPRVSCSPAAEPFWLKFAVLSLVALPLPDADGGRGRVQGHSCGGCFASVRWRLMLHRESHFPCNVFQVGARIGANSFFGHLVLFETLKIFVVFELMKVRPCFASRWWALRWTSLVEDVAATSRIRVPLRGVFCGSGRVRCMCA